MRATFLRATFLLVASCCFMANALTIRNAPASMMEHDNANLRISPSSQGGDFKDTILLLQGVRWCRMDLMNEIYGKWFGDVIFMVWFDKSWVHRANGDNIIEDMIHITGRDRTEIEDEFVDVIPHDWMSMRKKSFANNTLNDQIVYCHPKHRMTYQTHCLSPFLERHANSQFKGVLTMHMDFWINPVGLMKGSNLAQIWQLGSGLTSPAREGLVGPICFRNEQDLLNDGEWFWWDHANATGAAALNYLKAALHENRIQLSNALKVDDLETCAGWADLYYLPKYTWQDFVSISHFYGDVFHECAVPTVLSHLAKISSAGVSTISCDGSSVSSSDISNQTLPCGHHFDFRPEENRNRWKEWMKALRNP